MRLRIGFVVSGVITFPGCPHVAIISAIVRFSPFLCGSSVCDDMGATASCSTGSESCSGGSAAAEIVAAGCWHAGRCWHAGGGAGNAGMPACAGFQLPTSLKPGMVGSSSVRSKLWNRLTILIIMCFSRLYATELCELRAGNCDRKACNSSVSNGQHPGPFSCWDEK